MDRITATHYCPDGIVALFDDEKTTASGRFQVIEWLKTLDLKIGDTVWLPELGLMKKTVDGLQ